MSATYAAATTTTTATHSLLGGDGERAVKMEHAEPASSLSRRSTNQEEVHDEERGQQLTSHGRFAEASVAAMLAAMVPQPPNPTAAVVTERARAWHTAEAVARLFKRTKRASETYANFARALRDVGDGCEIGEELYVTAFIAGIGDEFTAALLRVVAPQSLTSAAQEASRLRDTDGAVQEQKAKHTKRTRHQRDRQRKQQLSIGGSMAQLAPSKPVLLEEDVRPRRVEKCVAEDIERVEAEADSLPRKKRRGACFACEQLGHIRRECPQRARLH